eukprot:924626-Prorocentrum_minimum.AAC.2
MGALAGMQTAASLGCSNRSPHPPTTPCCRLTPRPSVPRTSRRTPLGTLARHARVCIRTLARSRRTALGP